MKYVDGITDCSSITGSSIRKNRGEGRNALVVGFTCRPISTIPTMFRQPRLPLVPRVYLSPVVAAPVVALLCLGLAGGTRLHENYEAEYFSNVSLPCNYTLHGLAYPGLLVPIKRYWVLPNSSVITDPFTNNQRFIIHRPTVYDYTLIVSGIDDVDFGIYECVIVWNGIDYKMDVIKIGLNLHGPYYKEKYEDFQSNVIVGGAIAGAVFVTVVVACMVCSCRYSKVSKEHRHCHRPESPARLHSVYEYGSNPKLDRASYDLKNDTTPPESYAKVSKRGTSYECKCHEDPGVQSVRF